MKDVKKIKITIEAYADNLSTTKFFHHDAP